MVPPKPPLDRARWPQLSPLIDELLDLPERERAGRLATLRAEDPALADELKPWLAELAGLQDSAFLQAPAWAAEPAESAVAAEADAGFDLAGRTVGAYTLVRELGRGGMGSVWLAGRTDGRYDGEVAIKFLSAGLFAAASAQRFAREGQVLARLSHPHIARLLDAGHAAPSQAGLGTGQPYLVLEYVPGQPLDTYCQQRALPLAARLRLFLDVLDAVTHAHNRLILHRDLKPSNILVTSAGEVKLLDFGIAKLLDEAEAGELTQQAGSAYTLHYAAPEQLQGGEVTTATDVYALGVLLFRLLSGQLPLQAAEGDTLAQWKAVVEQPAPRMSDVVRRAGGAQAGQQSRALRGDLDTVVAKALKKAPAERYANAAALADDLRRHLAHLPTLARPDTWGYRSGKFLLRHRVAVGAGSLAALALAASTAVAVHEARQAQQQQAQAEGLIEFMLGDLPAKLKPVGRLDALDAVGDRALAYYAAQSPGSLNADSLGRRARALHLMGEITEQSGRFDEAAKRFEEAAASTAELLARHPDLPEHIYNHAQSAYWVGFIAYRRGRSVDAEVAFRQYLELADRLVALGPDNLDWRSEQAHAGQNLGVLQLEAGRPVQALQAFERTRRAWEQVVQARPPQLWELANTWGWIAKAHEFANDHPAALRAQQAKLDTLAGMPDAERNARVQDLQAIARLDIAQLQLAMGHIDAAQASARLAVTQAQALVQRDRQNLAWTAVLVSARLTLTEALAAAQARTEARAELAAVAALMQRLLGAPEPRRRWSLNLQGRWLLQRARLAEPGAPRAAVGADLQRWLADAVAPQGTGDALDAEQARIVAAAGLALGDGLQAGRDPGGATARWQAASVQLQPGLARREWPALALAARLHWRLGRIQEARALADELAVSPYRHPELLALQEELRSTGPPGRQAASP
jgi:eukaryotic-like serine/threonine-protein kinase